MVSMVNNKLPFSFSASKRLLEKKCCVKKQGKKWRTVRKDEKSYIFRRCFRACYRHEKVAV